MANTIMYVSEDTIPLFSNKSSTSKSIHLLWGDSVILQENLPASGRVKVKARGIFGYVNTGQLSSRSLLEYYFIDVGQGDGVLIVTPDRKHILIDGGYIRKKQITKRNAADFIDWKFDRDYGHTKISLDAMISSHNDEDHYGGLWDIINPNEVQELKLSKVEIGAYYYAGMNWFEKDGKRNLGPYKNGYWTLLLNSKTALKKHLPGAVGAVSTGYSLQGQWKDFISQIVKSTTT